ncbi:hypothetical protein [Deinococcus hopiensis]|uniref:Copper amine oxidase N-terminal domain-containing protein n=1 Tax=Deinococcus hopiensis KR-140 TaxID=695939 RepID=A0A1W1UNS5_9DEIO|nr:hypothetical protein [Deinococcus hopiensis]SMB82673.1 hypothetical protein SAMN00790413_04103 [Deinococcus hopiensis KR-140]
MAVRLKSTIAGVLALGLTGPALAATGYSVIVNGQSAAKPAVVINGETYVPLSALKRLGITSSLKGNALTLSARGSGTLSGAAPGGANQIAALEGCLNEPLFNGIWRVRVTSLEALRTVDPGASDTPGWAVTLEMRNGAQQTASLMETGFGAASGASQPALVLADGNTLTLDDNDFLQPWSKEVLQGGVMTFKLRFSFPKGTSGLQAAALKPSKFILQVNPHLPAYLGLHYSVPDPSFRVRLTCRK